MSWMVQGFPLAFKTEGEALAYAWKKTAPGEKRPAVEQRISAPPEESRETIKNLTEGVIEVSARPIPPKGSKHAGLPWRAWAGDEDWPLKPGEQIRIRARTPVTQEMVDEYPTVTGGARVRSLQLRMRNKIRDAALAHGVAMDPGSVKSAFVSGSEPAYTVSVTGSALPLGVPVVGDMHMDPADGTVWVFSGTKWCRRGTEEEEES